MLRDSEWFDENQGSYAFSELAEVDTQTGNFGLGDSDDLRLQIAMHSNVSGDKLKIDSIAFYDEGPG